MPNSPIDQFSQIISKSWTHIKNAEVKSIETKEKIAALLIKNKTKIFNNDCEFIVFGSLARNEFSQGSDLDWTLLIDGQAKLDHQDLVVNIRDILEENGFSKPGATGTFGGLTFSHDIIHHIGGLEDNNKNTTRRLLLLLESTHIQTSSDSLAYKNVVRNVLKRYLKKSFTTGDLKFPRFLLNDIVRYWRLICVDFAAKEWEQREYKWVVRNVKLRFSRKLLFVAGMLICYSFYERSKENIDDDQKIEEVINEYVFKTPLEILASFILKYDLKNIGEQLFYSYDYFLSIIYDEAKRELLNDIKLNDLKNNKLYSQVREQSHVYQEALTQLFFEIDTPLKDFTKKYGVF